MLFFSFLKEFDHYSHSNVFNFDFISVFEYIGEFFGAKQCIFSLGIFEKSKKAHECSFKKIFLKRTVNE